MAAKPNIVLIVVDSLRADRLGCYGNPGGTSPFLDSLAASGALGESFFASTIPAYSAFATLLSGVPPVGHEILSNETTADFPGEFPLAQEIFIKSGCTTCGIFSLRQARAWFGRGLEFSINPAIALAKPEEVTGREMNAHAIQWIRGHVNEPFFLFIHYREPRAALAKGADYLATGPDYLAKGSDYDDAVRAVDSGIRELVSAIDNLRLAPRTLIAVTSDRGVSLGEHGIVSESRGLYDCTVHIPFIARWPGHIAPGTRLKGMWQSEDIAPSLFEAVEMEVPSSMDGPRFWKDLTGQTSGSSRGHIMSLDCTRGSAWSVRTAQYKLILSEGPRRELYDLIADPREERDIASQHPEVAAALESELQSWVTRRIDELYRFESPFRDGLVPQTVTP
jgi:arylsulfatase A-like enzyme